MSFFCKRVPALPHDESAPVIILRYDVVLLSYKFQTHNLRN